MTWKLTNRRNPHIFISINPSAILIFQLCMRYMPNKPQKKSSNCNDSTIYSRQSNTHKTSINKELGWMQFNLNSEDYDWTMLVWWWAGRGPRRLPAPPTPDATLPRPHTPLSNSSRAPHVEM